MNDLLLSTISVLFFQRAAIICCSVTHKWNKHNLWSHLNIRSKNMWNMNRFITGDNQLLFELISLLFFNFLSKSQLSNNNLIKYIDLIRAYAIFCLQSMNWIALIDAAIDEKLITRMHNFNFFFFFFLVLFFFPSTFNSI